MSADFEELTDGARQVHHRPPPGAAHQAASATATVGRRVASPAMGTGSVLALQRSAGNRAVADMLGTDASLPVQRIPDEEGEEESEEG